MATLKEQTQEALTKLGTFAEPAQTVTATGGDARLTCRLLSLETVGCRFDELTVETAALADATTERLRELSERLSRRISYLLEPISPIETDADGCVVQMRSNPPQRDDDGATYYELLVRRGGSLALSRYRNTPAEGRRRIAAEVTREVLLRLVGDFEGVLVGQRHLGL